MKITHEMVQKCMDDNPIFDYHQAMLCVADGFKAKESAKEYKKTAKRQTKEFKIEDKSSKGLNDK